VWLADAVAANVVKYFSTTSQRPELVFIHLPDVDIAGHASGWMSDDYRSAVLRVDAALDKILQRIQASYGTDVTIIVTADHGGINFSHDNALNESRQIPWIAWGRGVHTQIIASPVRIVDLAPTVLWLLGVSVPTNIDGSPVTQAFQAPGAAGALHAASLRDAASLATAGTH